MVTNFKKIKMKKILFLLLPPTMAFAKNNSKYEDDWNKYVSHKVDSLSKLPGTKVVDNSKETTITYYVNGKQQSETFTKPVLVLPKHKLAKNK